MEQIAPQIRQAINRILNNTNEDADMDVLEGDESDNSGDEDQEEQPAEEDYDSRIFEEMKERAEPKLYRDILTPELTATPSNAVQAYNPSKMHTDAVVADGNQDFELPEANLADLMSVKTAEESYGYGMVGVQMQKRLKLRQPYE